MAIKKTRSEIENTKVECSEFESSETDSSELVVISTDIR